MCYKDEFTYTDRVIDHIRSLIDTETPNDIKAGYAGIASVLAASAYEKSVKSLLLDFSRNTNQIFHNYVSSSFDKLNAKISIPDLKSHYIKRFGNQYFEIFIDILEFEFNYILKTKKASTNDCYNNIITWRNSFAHNATPLQHADFNEVIESYSIGKSIIDCFYITLTAEV